MALTKLKELNGWTISVTDDGKFVGAKGGPYNEQKISRVKLADLEKEIMSRTTGSVLVLDIYRSNSSIPDHLPNPIEIVQATTDNRQVRDKRGSLYNVGRAWVLNDPAFLEQLKVFQDRKKKLLGELDEEYQRWLAAYPLQYVMYETIERMLKEQAGASDQLQP